MAIGVESGPISDRDGRIAGRTGLGQVPTPQAIEGAYPLPDTTVSSALRAEGNYLTPKRKAVMGIGGDLARQFQADGRSLDILISFYESVFPDTELLSFEKMFDSIEPDSPHSTAVKNRAIQEVIKNGMPDKLRKEIISIRQSAFNLRALGNTDPEEEGIGNSRDGRVPNGATRIVEDLGRVRWGEDEISALATAADSPSFKHGNNEHNWLAISNYLNRLFGNDRSANSLKVYYRTHILTPKKLGTAA